MKQPDQAAAPLPDQERRETAGDMLERALQYPYERPRHCYLYHGNQAHPVDHRDVRREGRVPVLAYGSNGSPYQLRRKFGCLAAPDAILVERCSVAGFDVVHSAHITSYGAVPAALEPHTNVTIMVAITWLSPSQLAMMDRSERAGRNYGRERIPAAVALTDDTLNTEVEAYLTSHGPLRIFGQIVSHGDVEAIGRTRPALRHLDILYRLHQAAGGGSRFEAFVIRLASDESCREQLTDRLKKGL